MDYVRLVKPEWFDHSGDAFKELAFRKHSDGTGLSIFDLECAEGESGVILQHVRKFYSDFIREGDVVFCMISDTEFPPNSTLIKTDDPDPCHWGLDAAHGPGKQEGEPIGVNKLKSYFTHKMGRENFFICDGDGTYRGLERADTEPWHMNKMLADGE